MANSAFEVQTYFYDYFSGKMNKYQGNGLHEIKNEIALTLYGPPDASYTKSDDIQLFEFYDRNRKERVLSLYDRIVDYKKISYDGETIYMEILFAASVRKNDNILWTEHANIKTNEMIIVPIFKIRECAGNNASYVYFDDVGGVYQDWAEYKKKNTMPKGVVIIPKDGQYSKDKKGRWEHEVITSPKSSVSSIAKNVVNIATTATHMGTKGLSLAASILTPTAIPGAVTTLIGDTTEFISIVKNPNKLLDPNSDLQKIRFNEAKKSWMNLRDFILSQPLKGDIRTTTSRLLKRNPSKRVQI